MRRLSSAHQYPGRRGPIRWRWSSRLPSSRDRCRATDTQQRKRRSVEAGAGAYMTAIKYVNQCAACHVLQFDSLIPCPRRTTSRNCPRLHHEAIYGLYSRFIPEPPSSLSHEIRRGRADPEPRLNLSAANPDSNPRQLANSPVGMGAAAHRGGRSGCCGTRTAKCATSRRNTKARAAAVRESDDPPRWLPRSEFDHEVPPHADLRLLPFDDSR